MDIREFLRTVITTNDGWFCLASADSNKQGWTEEWYLWPRDLEQICERIEALENGHNVYFSPFLFREKCSEKQYVLPTRTIVADLDEANVLTLPVKPTVLVETSADRHQAYWVLNEQPETLERIEGLSRNLTYAIPRCDRTGWFLGKKLRVPGTNNYKYSNRTHQVRIVGAPSVSLNISSFEALPIIAATAKAADDDLDWVEEANLDGPYELLEKYRSKLPPKSVVYYDREVTDGEGRSGALWALTTALFRAGASKEEVFCVAYHSANNKFSNLRYGGRRELGKDVLRAQVATNDTTPDLRAKIIQARRLPGIAAERRAYIAQIVKSHMEKIGIFVHAEDGSHWFIRHDQGKPISIIQRGETLQVFIDTIFGINATEQECNYIIHSLITHCTESPQMGVVSSLTYFDKSTRTLFIHTGRKDVLAVTDNNITTVIDGYSGVVFPWSNYNDMVQPQFTALPKPWEEILFGDCLDNLIGMSREHAMALLKTWVIMLLLRHSVVSRPILAIFGQPGAGKSTLFRRLYTLLYGRNKALSAVSTADDFDYACATDPLVVLDNVDTAERWLPDRMALAAAASDLQKRKLYTNGEVITVRRQALLGITAHNPQFGREDVNDRLILLNFERLTWFKPETDILDEIQRLRPALWGAIVQDVQKVLSTPQPNDADIPQFRVEDFARIGYWIATAVGIDEEFSAAITALGSVQKSFTLEEEGLLVESITKWMARTSNLEAWRTPGQLWPLFESLSSDSQTFKQKYKNAMTLGKKLWAMADALRTLYNVQWRSSPERGSREWRFLPKDDDATARITEIRTA